MIDSLFSHEAITDGIVVRVSVSYLPEQSAPALGRWFWSYHVRIENRRDTPVQLLTRHWVITDARGGQNRVDGEGVVGEQPVIQPGGKHDYVSGCPLPTPTGTMEGAYQMVDEGTDPIIVAIPRFSLVAPAVA